MVDQEALAPAKSQKKGNVGSRHSRVRAEALQHGESDAQIHLSTIHSINRVVSQ
jgi:hypothetical protein